MPARDTYHQIVIRALEKAGWRITHDPYHIVVGQKNLFVDLGAEQVIAAEREGKRIAIEVKRFGGPSEVHDLEQALGQYMLYAPFLRAQEPDRLLYLAISGEAWQNLFEEPIGRGVLNEYRLLLIVFDVNTEEITQWMPPP
jgi:hypothetical protein